MLYVYVDVRTQAVRGIWFGSSVVGLALLAALLPGSPALLIGGLVIPVAMIWSIPHTDDEVSSRRAAPKVAAAYRAGIWIWACLALLTTGAYWLPGWVAATPGLLFASLTVLAYGVARHVLNILISQAVSALAIFCGLVGTVAAVVPDTSSLVPIGASVLLLALLALVLVLTWKEGSAAGKLVRALGPGRLVGPLSHLTYYQTRAEADAQVGAQTVEQMLEAGLLIEDRSAGLDAVRVSARGLAALARAEQ